MLSQGDLGAVTHNAAAQLMKPGTPQAQQDVLPSSDAHLDALCLHQSTVQCHVKYGKSAASVVLTLLINTVILQLRYCHHHLMLLLLLPQVAGYSGLLLAAPTVLYEVIAYIVPGLTKSERKFLAPIVFGSSILFYVG